MKAKKSKSILSLSTIELANKHERRTTKTNDYTHSLSHGCCKKRRKKKSQSTRKKPGGIASSPSSQHSTPHFNHLHLRCRSSNDHPKVKVQVPNPSKLCCLLCTYFSTNRVFPHQQAASTIRRHQLGIKVTCIKFPPAIHTGNF